MRRRRKKNRILPVVIVLLLLMIIAALLLRFVFVVRNVDVAGDTGSMGSEAVIRAAKIQFGKSIFRVDADEITAGINATGHLRTDEIQVQYPDTLNISVSSRRRMAMALHLGKMRVLDENGCLVESFDYVPDEDLIYVSGLRIQNCAAGAEVVADSGQLDAYCSIMQAILDNSAAVYVSELNLQNTNDLRIITRTGIAVKLGSGENARDKIAWMKSAVSDLENRGQGGGILDVSSGTKADYRVR